MPFLHRNRKIAAVVEYVLSGHRFKLLIPKETCSIAFSFSGVRCPGRDEPYSDEASALMRRRIMQREVEVFIFLFRAVIFCLIPFLVLSVDYCSLYRLK